MTRTALPLTVAFAMIACTDPTTTAPRLVPGDDPQTGSAGSPGVHRQYGTPVKVGDGRARAYVTLDQKADTPVEFGVALDADAMQNLPAPMAMPPGMEHGDSHMYLLPLPSKAPAPYQLVELDWNPQGHGAPYTQPHFDFHFYTISQAERDAIDPSDPQYATKAAAFPAAAYIRPNFIFPGDVLGQTPAQMAVPHMGVHWLDMTAPELRGVPFTTTYITGTWNGKTIFQEPMITREFIMATSDATIPVPQAQRASPAGYYPGAYRITYDAQAKEYRIALSNLSWQQ